MEFDEKQLIERASRGEADAFNALLGAHEKQMYAVALRMCQNRDDAQDCLQEAMIRVFRAISGFKGQSSFATWLYRITMNTCLDELRRRKNRPNASLDSMLDLGWSPVDEGMSPERHAINSETRRQLNAAIARLPDDMRSAIVLRDIHGMTYEEIAAALDINVGTIKSRISRGRMKLREELRTIPELFGETHV